MVNEKRPCTPKESLEKSLEEMFEMRQGKTKKRTWEEVRKIVNNNTPKNENDE